MSKFSIILTLQTGLGYICSPDVTVQQALPQEPMPLLSQSFTFDG